MAPPLHPVRQMNTRTPYILYLLLAGVIIFSLDRLQAQLDATQQNAHLDRLSKDLNRHVAGFFDTRFRALAATRATLQNVPADRAADVFRAVVPQFFNRLYGVRGVILLDADCAPLAEWPPRNHRLPPPQRTLDNRSSLRQLADVARTQQDAAASPAIPLHDNDFSILAIQPLNTTATGAPSYIAAEFRIIRPLRSLLQPEDLPNLFISLKDHTGAPLLSGSPPPSNAPLRQTFLPVLDKPWRLCLQPLSSVPGGPPVARFAIWGLGLVLIIICSIFHFILAERNAALRDSNSDLQAQMDMAAAANERLRNTYKELDDFTYVVAHDIKEPLRGIETLTNMLIAEKGDTLDAAAREYLHLIKSSGARLRRLVGDLLRVSRISRRRYPFEQVDLNDIVAETAESLRVAIEQTGAEIRLDSPLPTLRCDRVRVAELFGNLLSNALKFTNGRPPVIRIGHVRAGRRHRFWVADNGMGVTPEDRERIFQVFQRSRSADGIEGTGVGLTICKRIVELHNGRIWVESAAGGGAAFHFTLQEPPPDSSASNETSQQQRASHG